MRMRPALTAIVVPLACSAALAADGLVPPRSEDVWPQWQARIAVGATSLSTVTLTADPSLGSRNPLQAGAIFSDYYFDSPGLRLPASMGGLRATGGLLVGPRGLALGASTPLARSAQRPGLAVQNGLSPLAADGSSDTVPYIGLGYTGLAIKGGWGFTADFGLVAENPSGAGRMGRAIFGSQSWDNAMRISPVLQVGVSYAF